MPVDRTPLGDFAELEEEDAKKSGRGLGAKRRFDEFECPACSAYNPFPAFGNNDEVLCNYCGLSFVALVDDEGKLRLKEA